MCPNNSFGFIPGKMIPGCQMGNLLNAGGNPASQKFIRDHQESRLRGVFCAIIRSKGLDTLVSTSFTMWV